MTFEEFAQKKFNGNVDVALQALAKEANSGDYKLTGSSDNMNEIVGPLTGEYAHKYLNYYKEEIEKSPQLFETRLKDSFTMAFMNISYEEVKNAKVNPYKAKIDKSLLKILISGVGIIALMLAVKVTGMTGVIPTVGGGFITLFSTYASADLADKIVKYFQFKKLKKNLDLEKNYELSDNEYEREKKL